MRKLKLHWQILIALVLAVVLGLIFGSQPEDSPLYTWPLAIFTFVGKMFMQGLKMIVVPLIVASVIAAIAKPHLTDGFPGCPHRAERVGT